MQVRKEHFPPMTFLSIYIIIFKSFEVQSCFNTLTYKVLNNGAEKEEQVISIFIFLIVSGIFTANF